MVSNLEKYKNDLEKLIVDGTYIYLSILAAYYDKKTFESYAKKILNLKTKSELEKFKNNLPYFFNSYQIWYTESLEIIKHLIPDRLDDFIRLYKKPENRQIIDYETYVIEDLLISLSITKNNGKVEVVGPKAAIPKFLQQLNILESAKRRFESSLLNIKQFLQADLFDSEIASAKELNNKGFVRSAGAIAGVVLEKHLMQVCENHNIIVSKKNLSIKELNQLLKDNNIIEIKDWRFIQHLEDLRNLCDHNKEIEPKKEEIDELINGVEKITKTIF